MIGFSAVGPESPFSFVLVATIALILVASWVILAGSRFVQGGVVEHPQRVPQLYGYTVCLVALFVGLASFKSVVESGLTLADPTQSSQPPWNSWGEPSVTSLEAFRVTYERTRELGAGPNSVRPEPLTEAELTRRYEALRADRIIRNRVAAQRSLVISGLLLVIATVLFAIHWRWLRRRRDEGRPVVAASA